METRVKEHIKAKHAEVFGASRHLVPITWLENFVEFLTAHNVNEEQTKELIERLLSKENLSNMAKSDFKVSPFINNERDFFNYLSSIESELTPEYCEAAYEYVLKNSENGNVIDSFIKYLVITRFDDITVQSNVSELKVRPDRESYIYCCLGDFKICRVNAYINDENYQGNIIFDELHTRRNLTGVKVGSILFQTLFSEVHKHFPDRDLMADRVMKRNVGGIRFYERMGGKFFDLKTGKTVNSSQIDNTSAGNIGVCYKKEDLLELSRMKIIRPTLDEDKKKIVNKKV